MYIKKKYTSVIIKAVKDYLAAFKKANDSPIPLHLKDQTKELKTVEYPIFYIKRFKYAKDLQRVHGNNKYEYDYKENNEVDRKERPVPYNIQFNLEYLTQDPDDYEDIKEWLEKKFKRIPEFVLDFAGNIENVRIVVSSAVDNESSEIPHVFWTVIVKCWLDVSMSIEGAVVNETITMNDKNIEY